MAIYSDFNIGKYGERAACVYLQNIGYSIITVNLRLKSGEIDILAKLDYVFHIIEVKTCSTNTSMLAEENLNSKKLFKLALLAKDLLFCLEDNRFCFMNNIKQEQGTGNGHTIQVDAICVYLTLITLGRCVTESEMTEVRRIRLCFYPNILET